MNQNLTCNGSHQYGRSLNILLAAVAAFAIGILFHFYQDSQSISAESLQKATSLQSSPRELPSFSLTNHLSNPFGNQDLIGSWNMIFFGFTNCPDVCPLTLNTLDQVTSELEGFSAIPRSIFISVDPKRDQPENLKKYVEHFNQDMIGLMGSKEQIDNLTQSIGAIYAIGDESKDNYLVDHSAHIFVTAPNGKMIALFSTPHDAKVIANDFKIISELYEKNKS
ncbi:MAG: SCO family protein [Gammaproteobacteria bacterium]